MASSANHLIDEGLPQFVQKRQSIHSVYEEGTRNNRLSRDQSSNHSIHGVLSKPIRTTEFTALIYDLTDRNRLVATVPVAPSQRETRILASAFDIERRDFPEEHKYRVMIAIGSTALAQAQFTIKESKKNRGERLKREKALKGGRSVEFSR